MKYVIAILSIFVVLCCGEQQVGTTHLVAKNCGCTQAAATDSVFYAAALHLKEQTTEKIIVFRCAEIETAIASVSDLEGNEYCKNLYDIKCISNSKREVKLHPNFRYYSDEMRNRHLIPEVAQDLFLREVQKNDLGFFELNLNQDGEVEAISKLTIE